MPASFRFRSHLPFGRIVASVVAWSAVAFVALEAIDSAAGNRITVPAWQLLLDATVGAIGAVLLRKVVDVRGATAIVTAGAVVGSLIGAALVAFEHCVSRRNARDTAWITALFVISLLVRRSVPWIPPVPLYQGSAGVVVLVLAVAVLGAASAFVGAHLDLRTSIRREAASRTELAHNAAARARAEERNALARDMHDILTHRLSLISLHASALDRRRDLTSDEISEIATTLRATSRAALEEIRALVRQLRELGDTPNGLSVITLDDLWRSWSNPGVHIDVHDRREGEWDTTSPLFRHTVHIVQEALNNAHRHGAHGPVTVVLTGAPDGNLTLEISNPLVREPGGTRDGTGLQGVAERVHLCGGGMTIERTERSFTLTVWLPWES